MKNNNKEKQYAKFANALKTVLRVSHADLKAHLEAEKKTKKRRLTRPSASHVSREKD